MDICKRNGKKKLIWLSDKVGKVAAYNESWEQRTGFPLIMIQGAAHNANDDQPDKVNAIIRDFIETTNAQTER